MKILYLFEKLPYPPKSGISWMAFNLITFFSRFHNCDLLCFGEEQDLKAAQELSSRYKNIKVLGIFLPNKGISLRFKQISAFLRGDLPSTIRYQSINFSNALKDALENNDYDLVHINLFNLAPYRNLIKNLPVILDSVDAYSLALLTRINNKNHSLLQRITSRIFLKTVINFEKKWYPTFESVQVVSREDAKYYKNELQLNNILSIPLFVTKDFLALKIKDNTSQKINIFISVALNFKHIRNPVIDFLKKHWPPLTNEFPQLKLTLLGRNGSPKDIEFFKRTKNVIFTDWVDNYASTLSNMDIVLVLDQGGEVGIKTRVIQALGAAKAVIGTTIGFRGLKVKNNIHCFVCSENTEIVKLLRILIKNPKKRHQMSASARKFIRANYSYLVVGKMLNAFYSRLLHKYSI